jgi:NitT/TauT family transport system ATP-binding protein
MEQTVERHRRQVAADNLSAASRSPRPVLEAVDVTKVYKTRQGDVVRALSEVTLTLNDGEFVSVVGPSGCGKSTLMKVIAGIIPKSSGNLKFGDELEPGTGRGVGVVFQTPVLLPWLTIIDNVLLPARVLKLDRALAMERALQLLGTVGLGGFEKKYPNELSGGMQQRAAIVRSFIHEPGLLLMDEPFGALDALTRELMTMELQRLWLTDQKTVFFITHSIIEAVFQSDRVIVMSARPGRILREIAVPFPRPRKMELTTTPEFGTYVTTIRNLLGATLDA